MARRRGGRDKSLKRKAGRKELGRTHWIFCEGGTEGEFLNDLRVQWRMPTLRVHICRNVGTPWTVVDRAREKRDELGRRGNHQIYVVFDRDEHPRFREAIQRARELGFVVGFSVPCFELWALLLHQDQTASIHRHRAQSELKKIHKGYCHKRNPRLDVQQALPLLTQAAGREATLRRLAMEAGDEFRNPSTAFSQVIQRIQS